MKFVKDVVFFLVYEFVSLSVDKLVSLIDIIAISKSFKVVKN